MNSDFSRRPGWWCRLADLLGVVADIGSAGDEASNLPGGDRGPTSEQDGNRGAPASRSNLLLRPLIRHVSRCPRCRAEQAEWSRVLARLQEVERPTAPDSLFDGLMARIAEERAEQRRSKIGLDVERVVSVPSETHASADRRHASADRTHASPDRTHASADRTHASLDRGPSYADGAIGVDGHWLVPLLAVAAALGFAAVPAIPASNLAETVRHIVGASREAARVVILDVFQQTFHGVSSLGTSGWPGDEIVVGLIWCLIGLGVTLAVSVVSGTITQDP